MSRRRAAVIALLGALWLTAVDALWSLTTNSFALTRFRWWLLGAACTVTLAAAIVAARRQVQARVRSRVWVERPGSDWIRRAGLEDKVVALLTASGLPDSDMALIGAGGFGKTTLARKICWHSTVRRRFRHAVWVTLGQNPSRADLLALINDVYWRLSGLRLDANSLEQASQSLGSLLDGGDCVLLVVDDVWRQADLQPFLTGGTACTRLITTRRPGVLPAEIQNRSVRVDEFTPTEARACLTFGVPGLRDIEVRDILQSTGCWPLLITLAHARLRVEIAGGFTAGQAARRLRDLLTEQGAATLSLENVDSRNRAATASVEASLNMLDSMDQGGRERFHQLASFGEDVDIPLILLEALWNLGSADVDALCERLHGLSLVTDYDRRNRTIRLHDVMRSIIRADRPGDLVQANNRILVAIERQLTRDAAGRPQWWQLVGTSHYCTRHMCKHMSEANRDKELVELLLDLRWTAAKLGRPEYGPLSLDADFATCPDPTVSILRRAIRCSAHLLAPMTPEHALSDTLVSRLAGIAELQQVVAAYRSVLPAAYRLVASAPLPDQPHPALRHVFTDAEGSIDQVVASPGGEFVATGGSTGSIRLWDPVTGSLVHEFLEQPAAVRALACAGRGSLIVSTHYPTGSGDSYEALVWDPAHRRPRRRLTGHRAPISSLSVPESASFVVTACEANLLGEDESVRVWEAATGVLKCELKGHVGGASLVAVAADGSVVATVSKTRSDERLVRLWSPLTGKLLASLPVQPEGVAGLAVAGDGSFVVTGNVAGVVSVWDTTTGSLRRQFEGHTGWPTSIAISNDLRYMATACAPSVGDDRVVRVWDLHVGALKHELMCSAPDSVATGKGIGGVGAIAISSDGATLISASSDATVRVWDMATGTVRDELEGHTGWVGLISLPEDASFVATASGPTIFSNEGTARVWDLNQRTRERRRQPGHTEFIYGISTPSNAAFVATASADCTARIWNAPDGTLRHTLVGHTEAVSQIATAADGSFVVTGAGVFGTDPAARIWDPVSGQLLQELPSPPDVTALGVPAGGSFVAAAASGGYLRNKPRPVRIYEMPSGRLAYTLLGHQNPVSTMAMPADGSYIVTAGDPSADKGEGIARMWDTVNGRLRFDIGGIGSVQDVLVPADGSFIATLLSVPVTINVPGIGEAWSRIVGRMRRRRWYQLRRAPKLDDSLKTELGVLQVWSPETGSLLRQMSCSSSVTMMAAPPGGRPIVTLKRTKPYDRRGGIRVWDPTSGTCTAEIPTGDDDVRAIAVSDDGSFVAGVSHNGAVHVWSCGRGTLLASLRVDTPLERCHVRGDLILAAGSRHLFWLRLQSPLDATN